MSERSRGRPRDSSKGDAILDAATALFLERGYEAASVDAVARAAGVAKATIYARYSDKDTLFSAVMHRHCAGSVAPAAFVSSELRPTGQVLAGVAETFLARLLDPQGVAVFRILVAEAERACGAAEQFYQNSVSELSQHLADWLREETERGRLQVGDPEDAAWRFLGAVMGETHLRALMGLPPLAPDRRRAHVAACVDDFLRAHGRGRDQNATLCGP